MVITSFVIGLLGHILDLVVLDNLCCFMNDVMLGRVTSACNLNIFCSLESVIYLLSCLEYYCDPVVPSSPVHDSCMDIKCTVERLGSRAHCYAEFSMPSLWQD